MNLAQLLADGPVSDLALTADVRGGGKSLETLTGAVDLSVPASQVRKATVGPVELHATADRGTYDLRELRAVLPGLRVTGRGKGTTKAIEASVDAEATDLALLGRTFGSLSASRFPRWRARGSSTSKPRGRCVIREWARREPFPRSGSATPASGRSSSRSTWRT